MSIVLLRHLRGVQRPCEGRRVVVDIGDIDHHASICCLAATPRTHEQIVLQMKKEIADYN